VYDLKLENGLIVDGTGEPGRVGAVGVTGGRIVAVGEAPDAATRTIDASGKVIAPGVIDVHTHLDAQVLWDPRLGISPDHGVTTVVFGNCGFGVAPTHAGDRELIMRTLENVEGIDFDCMKIGLGDDWGFETFPEYFAALDRADKTINMAGLVGHTPIRHFVMRDAAAERAASVDEVNEMRRLVNEALDVGAIGVSTSGSPTHIGAGGKPVPSRFATFDEILTLASALEGRDPAIFMCTIGPDLSFPEMRRIAESTGKAVTFGAILADLGGVGRHRSLMERVEAIQRDGLDVVPQVSCRPVLFEFNLREPYALTTSAPGMMRVTLLDELFAPVFQAPSREEKLAAYRSDGFAQRFVELTDSPTWHERLWAFTTVVESRRHPEYEQVPITELALSLGKHPAEVVLDLSIESNLEDRFVMGFVNNDEAEVKRLLLHPGTQIGLSDAGAHASMICDACYPTYLLGQWVREKQAIPLEYAVAMLSGRPAKLFGLRDRGVIAAGHAADVLVFDPEVVDADTPRLVFDLPGGAARLVAESRGIDALVVNGVVVRDAGGWTTTDRSSGRLLRHGAG
jgi:N-acyl-D-aspartate/D-glutamate deacylase